MADLRKAWKAGDRYAPYIAVWRCQRRRKKIPGWALNVIMDDGLRLVVNEQKKMYESRRYRQADQDTRCHDMVLLVRQAHGLSWDKAFEDVAELMRLSRDSVRNGYIRVVRREKSPKTGVAPRP